MCGTAQAEIDHDDIAIFLGFSHGWIGIKDRQYKFKHGEGWTEGSRQELITHLCKYDKHNLVVAIADLIENTMEG